PNRDGLDVLLYLVYFRVLMEYNASLGYRQLEIERMEMTHSANLDTPERRA
ncbi:MAG: hypothetical protein K0R39_5104, partial [Symbiobacteriaceae bacterium]|nr:hypothetical protein [Symbiobacteriaceae bacterium]